MNQYKNIAITGSKGAGKSTLACWLLEKMGLPYTGFRTERYALTPQGPVYMLVDVTSGAAVAISRLLPEGIRGIPEAFEGFGARQLERYFQADVPVVLLDEIGRFERNSPAFLAGLEALLDSEKTVIAVLKREDLPHIRAIGTREDTLLVDLEGCSRADCRELLEEWGRRRGIF